MEQLASEKETLRDKTIKRIGNYVHDSVPVSDDEVHHRYRNFPTRANVHRPTMLLSEDGPQKESKSRRRHAYLITRSLLDWTALILSVG